MKVSILRYAAIGMASLSMAGFAAASTVSVAGGNGSATGPDSVANITLDGHTKLKLNNTNMVGVGNTSIQGAASGHVKAKDNATVGTGAGEGVASGEAANENGTQTTVMLTNTPSAGLLGALAGGGVGAGSVDVAGGNDSATGPDSTLNISIDNSKKVKVNNTNVVQVSNTSVQGATSGNVEVNHNTKVGSVQSGAASNANTTINDVTITN